MLVIREVSKGERRRAKGSTWCWWGNIRRRTLQNHVHVSSHETDRPLSPGLKQPEAFKVAGAYHSLFYLPTYYLLTNEVLRPP